MSKVLNQGDVKIENQNIYFNKDENSKIYDNLEFTVEFQKRLDHIGVGLVHPKIDSIEFDDLYTCPDLKSMDFKGGEFKFNQYRNLSNIVRQKSDSFKILLLGGDIAGKSSALKYLTKWFFFKGYIPILLNGDDIKNNIRITSVLKRIKKQYLFQYDVTDDFDNVLSQDADKFVILIDDFHLCAKKKSNYWYYLIQNIQSKFSNIILTGGVYTPLETLLTDSEEPIDIFEDFDMYTLQVFGPKLRYKIAEKWNRLGVTFPELEKNDVLAKVDESVRQIEQIIGRGHVPAYPLYILTLLQAFSNQQTIQSAKYSIHGFYYELLINTSLSKAVKDTDDIGVFNNLLSHIAYYFFIERKSRISKIEFDRLVKDFGKFIDVEDKFSVDGVLQVLSDAKLINVDSYIYFYPKYIYYFFVAKYLANNLNSYDDEKSKNIKSIVSKLSKRLYQDEFSSIIIFLTHLSKDKYIINELLSSALAIFSEFPITKLEEDVEDINELIKVLPDQVINLITVEKARDEQLDFQEKQSIAEKEFDELSEDEALCHYDEDIVNIDVFEQLSLALNTIEILGQITKKYWGELDGELKYKIASETYFLGLRTMSLVRHIILGSQEGILKLLKNSVERKMMNDKYLATNYDIKEYIKSNANQYLFRLAFLSFYGIVKRVSNSIGSKKITNTLARIIEDNPHNSVKLIDASVKLDFRYSFPWDELGDEDYIIPNRLSYLIKQNLITHYLYIYETDHNAKLKIANKFNIKIKDQIVIDRTSKEKRKTKR